MITVEAYTRAGKVYAIGRRGEMVDLGTTSRPCNSTRGLDKVVKYSSQTKNGVRVSSNRDHPRRGYEPLTQRQSALMVRAIKSRYGLGKSQVSSD